MRVRSVLITAVAGIAFVGASATAAQAGPGCCNGIENKGPTPTTIKPKGPDKLAPKPTTTTTVPKPNFEGPDKLSDTPKDPIVDPAPQPGPQDGPDDIADAPKDNGGDKGGNTDNGGGSNNGGSTDNGGSSDNGGASVDNSDQGTSDTTVAPESSVDTETVAKAHNESGDSSHVPAFMIIFFALLTAGLIGLVVARMRREDEDAETI